MLRAIVREFGAFVESDGVWWVPCDRDEPMLSLTTDAAEVTVISHRPAPEIVSLMQRVLERPEIVTIARADPVGRLLLDGLASPPAAAASPPSPSVSHASAAIPPSASLASMPSPSVSHASAAMSPPPSASSALVLPLHEPGRSFGMVIAWSRDSQAFDDGALAGARAYGRVAGAALTQAHLFAQLAERNAALADRDAVVRDLVYALSHDVRTPLAALGMTLRQADEGAYGELPPSYHAVVRSSVAAIDDLQRLADTLLSVARWESTERVHNRERIDVCQVIDQCVLALASLADKREVKLVTHVERAAFVWGDVGDLRRALANLIANAIEHTPAGGSIELGLTLDDAWVAITVSDNGFGVPAPIRAALFERFTTQTARAGGGTGLGLYLVRRIAQTLGGTVRYEPREGGGSIFTLTLPRTGKVTDPGEG